MGIQVTNYPQDYLYEIQTETFPKMDSTLNGGNGDGKITPDEAYNDLDINSLFSELKEGSKEYEKLKSYTDKIPEAIVKYSGEDEEFSPEEWAEFLNGKEWGNVIDAYHCSSNFCKKELEWIDDKGICDGQTTKGEIKVNILNNLAYLGYDIDTTEIEALIDKYAGQDGIFSAKEYTSMKNDETYKDFLDKYALSALPLKGSTSNNEVQTEKASEDSFIKKFFDKICEGISSIFSPKAA